MNIYEIRQGVYRIRTPFDKTGTVFLYLLKGDRIALIDTGTCESPGEVLQPALREIGLTLGDIEVVLNTHAHTDHSGGNDEVKRSSKASFHLHAKDLLLAESADAQAEFHTAPLRVLGFPADMVQQRAERLRFLAGEPVATDVVLTDGDTVELGRGITLRVIHAPGHTPGHVVYLWESENILFTGDAAQGQGARPGSYPYYFDAASYRRSIARLQTLNPHALCLGHAYLGGTLINSPLRQGAEAKAFLEASAAVADTIHRAAEAAVKMHAGASKREIVVAALADLLYEIPQLRLRRVDMPQHGAVTTLAHVDAVLSGDYPAA